MDITCRTSSKRLVRRNLRSFIANTEGMSDLSRAYLRGKKECYGYVGRMSFEFVKTYMVEWNLTPDSIKSTTLSFPGDASLNKYVCVCMKWFAT